MDPEQPRDQGHLLRDTASPSEGEKVPLAAEPLCADREDSSLHAGADRPRILVIDDENFIISLLQRTLKPLGYEVDGALGGEEALSLLGERVYDLVILDVKMPGPDGRQIYALVNERYPTLRQRVIGDTASVETQCFLQKRESPYLTKPFDLEEVQRVVRDYLNQQKP